MASFKDQIQKGGTGAIAGAIIGFIIGKFFLSVNDLQSIFQSQSIFDSIVGGASITIKSAWFFALLGAVLGFFVQTNFDKIRKVFG